MLKDMIREGNTRSSYDVRIDEYNGQKTSAAVIKFGLDVDKKMKKYKYYTLIFKASGRIYFAGSNEKEIGSVKYGNYMLQFGKKEIREKLRDYHGEYILKCDDCDGKIYCYIDLESRTPLQNTNPNRKSEVVRHRAPVVEARENNESESKTVSQVTRFGNISEEEFNEILKIRIKNLEDQLLRLSKRGRELSNLIDMYESERVTVEQEFKTICDRIEAIKLIIDPS